MPSKPEKQRKQSVVKESYDDLVNAYLKMHLIESDLRMDPREGFDGDPFVDPTEDMSGNMELTPEEMRKVVAVEAGEEQASMMSDQEIERYYNEVVGGPEENVEYQEMYIVVSQAMGEEKASMLSPEEIKQAYYYIEKDPSMGQDGGNEEDYEEECEDNCQCDRCKGGNGEKMLNFYGFTK